jgi:hypothetical protein
LTGLSLALIWQDLAAKKQGAFAKIGGAESAPGDDFIP